MFLSYVCTPASQPFFLFWGSIISCFSWIFIKYILTLLQIHWNACAMYNIQRKGTSLKGKYSIQIQVKEEIYLVIQQRIIFRALVSNPTLKYLPPDSGKVVFGSTNLILVNLRFYVLCAWNWSFYGQLTMSDKAK